MFISDFYLASGNAAMELFNLIFGRTLAMFQVCTLSHLILTEPCSRYFTHCRASPHAHWPCFRHMRRRCIIPCTCNKGTKHSHFTHGDHVSASCTHTYLFIQAHFLVMITIGCTLLGLDTSMNVFTNKYLIFFTLEFCTCIDHEPKPKLCVLNMRIAQVVACLLGLCAEIIGAAGDGVVRFYWSLSLSAYHS